MSDPQQPLPQRVDSEPAMMRYFGVLLADGASGRRDLHVLVVDAAGTALPVLTCIDGIAADPDPTFTTNLFLMMRRTVGQVAPGGSVALALERPGSREPCASDQRWAAALQWAAHSKGVPLRGPYLVVDGQVRRITAHATMN